jgi:hypothetical protein
MPTSDGFDPAHPLPVFLDDQYEQQGVGTARGRFASSSRIVKAGMLMLTAAVVGIAVLSGNPLALFTEVTASLVDNLGLQPAAAPSTPAIEVSADAQAVPPAAQQDALVAQDAPTVAAATPAAPDTPPRAEVAAAEPSPQDQAEKSEPTPEALFRQFQAWAAEKDARADATPDTRVQDEPPAAQNAPSPAVENAPAPAADNPRPSLRIMQEPRVAQEPRHVRPAHSARAEMRTQNLRKQVRRPLYARPPIPPAQIARAEAARAQDARAEAARAQEQPAPQAPPFLPIFGGRN